jgi:AraC-like DNA-binding protein
MHKSLTALHESTVRLKFVGTYYASEGKHYPPHSHSTWELIYYRTGRIECVVDGASNITQPGMVLLIPPGAIHEDRALSGYSQIFIRITALKDQPWPRVCYDDTDGSWETLCRTIEHEWRNESQYRPEMLNLLAHQLDLRLRHAAPEGLNDPWEETVRAAESLMEAKYSQALSVEEVAMQVGMSPSRLRAHFVRLRGRSPQATLQAIRLRQATDLIRHSSLKLEAIADLCGYHSASHLSRYVRRETGKSPGRLRV